MPQSRETCCSRLKEDTNLRVPRCPKPDLARAREQGEHRGGQGAAANCSHAEAPWERVRGRPDVGFPVVKGEEHAEDVESKSKSDGMK